MRADGERFPAELAISRVDVPGAPLFTACIRDLTDGKRTEEKLRAAEFRYRTLVEQLPLISYVDSPDSPVDKPLYLSPQIAEVLGRTVDEWLSAPGLFADSLHPLDRRRVLEEKEAAYRRGEALRSEYRMLAADGRTVWVEDQSVPVHPPDGGPPFRQGFAIDISDRKAAEEALLGAEGRYRTLVEQLPLVVYIDAVDAISSSIYASPQIEDLLGYSPAEWRDDPLLFVRLLHRDDRERVLAAHAHTHATGEPLSLEYRLLARDGREIWVHDEGYVLTDASHGQVLQGYLLDVTERRRAEQALRHQALHDPLTGLANRTLFGDRLQHAIDRLVDDEAAVAVIALDIDDFTAVNDSLGHQGGDALLRSLGARLCEAVSPGTTVARLGGDEFGVLVEDPVEAAAVTTAAARVSSFLQAPFRVAGDGGFHEVFVTASLGLAVGRSADELLRTADVAMYRAKTEGKAQHVVYTPALDTEVLGRLDLIADLRRASFERDLVLHYQPTVDLSSGLIAVRRHSSAGTTRSAA